MGVSGKGDWVEHTLVLSQEPSSSQRRRAGVFFHNPYALLGSVKIKFHIEAMPGIDGVDLISAEGAARLYGLSTYHMRQMTESMSLGITDSCRAKTAPENNTREDESAPKPVTEKVKTAPSDSLYMGHLIVSVPGKKDALTQVTGDVFEIIDEHGKKNYVTYERQSLQYIRAKIIAGEYKVFGCSITEDGKSAKMVISDQANPPNYCMLDIDLQKAKLDTGLRAKVKSLAMLFSDGLKKVTQHVLTDGNFTQAMKDALDINSGHAREMDAVSLLSSGLITNNLEQTVIMLPFNKETDKNGDTIWQLNPNPNVLCYSNGKPIKGDVDAQNNIITDELPVDAYAFLNFDTKGNYPDEIEKIITRLDSLMKELAAGPVFQLVKAAREKLELQLAEYNNENASIKDKESIIAAGKNKLMNLGAISLIKAVHLIGGPKSDMLHGPDSGSPIWPENITVCLTPADKNITHFFRTHGELAYVNMLHENNQLQDKLVDINPCWLVKAPEYTNKNHEQKRWRGAFVDKSDSDHDLRMYNNLVDEDKSIALWKLLLEKQLLLYKQKYGATKFQQYISVVLNNYKNMVENPMTQQQDKLVVTINEGIGQARVIFEAVLNKPNLEISQRLKDIELEVLQVNNPENKQRLNAPT